jgi:beta-galactosidase
MVHIGIVDQRQNLVWNDVQVGTDRMTSHWNRTPGAKLKLYTYTNADEVELLLNGKSLGKQQNDRKNSRSRNRILWTDVEYQPGTLIARAYTNGKLVATHQIETTGAAVRLQAEADPETWQADGMDLQHIRITAQDAKGRTVATQTTPVHFTVSGDAEIIGVINGDMSSDELSVGDTRRLYNGTCTVILRSHRTPSKVTLQAEAEGLKPVTLKLMTR